MRMLVDALEDLPASTDRPMRNLFRRHIPWDYLPHVLAGNPFECVLSLE